MTSSPTDYGQKAKPVCPLSVFVMRNGPPPIVGEFGSCPTAARRLSLELHSDYGALCSGVSEVHPDLGGHPDWSGPVPRYRGGPIGLRPREA